MFAMLRNPQAVAAAASLSHAAILLTLFTCPVTKAELLAVSLAVP